MDCTHCDYLAGQLDVAETEIRNLCAILKARDVKINGMQMTIDDLRTFFQVPPGRSIQDYVKEYVESRVEEVIKERSEKLPKKRVYKTHSSSDRESLCEILKRNSLPVNPKDSTIILLKRVKREEQFCNLTDEETELINEMIRSAQSIGPFSNM